MNTLTNLADATVEHGQKFSPSFVVDVDAFINLSNSVDIAGFQGFINIYRDLATRVVSEFGGDVDRANEYTQKVLKPIYQKVHRRVGMEF